MEELKDYIDFGIRDDMVSKDSPLNTPEITDNIEFEGYNEGVPGSSLLLGGLQMKKKTYSDTTAGIWTGIDSDGLAKINVGDSTNSMKWNGSTLAIAGALSASSLDIPDTTTADSFHVNTLGDVWWGATAIGSAIAKILKTGIATFTNVSITGGSLTLTNASIDSSGLATFVGITTLNMKAYTSFEYSASSSTSRFIWSTGATTNAPVFGNQGVLVSPSATASRYCKILWQVTQYVFNNNPSFTCSVQLLTLGANAGVGFIGLGNPTISETGFTETGTNYCGFEFKKTSGTTTLIATQCDGSGTNTFSSTLLTLSSNSSLELFIKMTSSGVNYYTRVNGGALSSVTTLTTNMPSGADSSIQFSSSNKGDAVDFQLQPWSASYEH